MEVDLAQCVIAAASLTPEHQAQLCARHLTDALREAMLHAQAVLLRGANALDDLRDDPRAAFACDRLLASLSSHPQPLIFSCARPVRALDQALRGLIELRVPKPSRSDQARIWCDHLRDVLPQDHAATVAHTLARQYTLTQGAISRIFSHTRASARAHERALSLPDLQHTIRREFTHSLGDLAQFVHTQLSWADLVVGPEIQENIQEILNAVRHSVTVLEDWGFGKKYDHGRGTSCLFDGPPGTGKTMTALLLANELGQETYRIDLSRVVNKYIGETEKNLSRIFDEAERAQAILLFDEADSLFSKRTDVSSSNDRYANLEVNFLLQRVESFDGICILTTNFESSIDEAFKRRIRFRISFPFPNPKERARLWRSMFPPGASLEPDIDFDGLANDYELSGGGIKNAVLRAAFSAAQDGCPIHTEHLHLAATRECMKMGQLVRKG